MLELVSGQGERREATAELLSAITTPTLVLHGENDNLIPIEHGKQFADAIPGAKLITYPGVGHLPQEETAALSESDLRAFLTNDVYGVSEVALETAAQPQN